MRSRDDHAAARPATLSLRFLLDADSTIIATEKIGWRVGMGLAGWRAWLVSRRGADMSWREEAVQRVSS